MSEQDYVRKARLLRQKANDKTVKPEEAKLLNDKADELEAKYAPPKPEFTRDDADYDAYFRGEWVPWRNPAPKPPPQTFRNEEDGTTVTSNTGQGYEAPYITIMDWLLKMQHLWNKARDEEDSTQQDYQYSETENYDRTWQTGEEDEDDESF